ncbi:hypothetical protein QOZ80_5AG0395380 [Eleusine coracana subsp. coracana]|nr:hypothetical protein QOZ80_5AG0395380 [Eleusine coracana subsp. coracana]
MDMDYIFSSDLAAGLQAEDLRFSLPRFDTPSEVELLEHLRLRSQRYLWEREMDGGLLRMAGLNTGLPEMNPWELPGMTADEHGRASGKYYVTNCFQLQTDIYSPTTPQGFWKPRDLGRGVLGKSDDPRRFIGLKRTYRFYTGTNDPRRFIGLKSTETIWTMNVYYLLNEKNFVRDDLVLCHVFEDKSANCDPQLECVCHGTPTDKGVTVPMLYGLVPLNMASCDQQAEEAGDRCNSVINPRSSGSTQPTDPEFACYVEELEKTLLGDPEIPTDTENYDPNLGGPSNGSVCTENEQTRKRSRNKSNKSPVWERFTKVFARSTDGILTFAVCNHCFKVLKGDSSNGTSHLKRHKCPCNHKQPNS